MKIRSLLRSSVPSLLACAVLVPAATVRADPFDSLDELDQGEFLELSRTLSAATHYKAVAPAEALGIIGFDVGVEISATDVDEALFDRASDGDHGGQVLVPRLHVHKGLPFGIDIGAVLGTMIGTDLSLIGGELRLALIEGGVATPAIALRASYSRAQGGSDVELDNAALELTISKGFLMVTPYAGIGLVHGRAEPLGTDALAEESFDQEKLFVGANVNLVGFNLAAELDRTGDHNSLSAKVGFRF